MRPVTKISLFGVRLAILALIAYWILIFAGTHLPKLPNFAPDISDKIKHFAAFFGLATLLCYVTNSANLLRRFSFILVICIVYAAVDELTQGFVRGRVPDVLDFAADAFGVTLATGIYAGCRVVADTYSGNRGVGQPMES